MKLSHILASGLFALTFGVFSAPAQAGVFTFNFSGVCIDCTDFEEPFEPVSGVLKAIGDIETFEDPEFGEVDVLFFTELVSFSYSGSALLPAFTVLGGPPVEEEGPPGGFIDGFVEYADDGGIAYSYIGLGGFVPEFDFVEFYFETAFEEFDEGFGEGDGFGPGDGFWEIYVGFDDCECDGPADFGLGSITAAPAPGALALLGVGLLGLGARRRWFA